MTKAKKNITEPKKSLTDGIRQGRNTGVEPQENILSNSILPGTRAELRSGDARRATCGPHTSAHAPGCFYEGTV